MTINWSQMHTVEAVRAKADAAERDRIKARRDMAIAGGITLGGIGFATDDVSQHRIMGAALAALIDPEYSVQWKTPDGFVTLDAQTIIGAAQAVRAHVQACFDREAQLLAARAAGEAYDLAAGWPS